MNFITASDLMLFSLALEQGASGDNSYAWVGEVLVNFIPQIPWFSYSFLHHIPDSAMAGYSEFRMEKWMKLVSPGKSPKTVDFFVDTKW